MRNRTLSPAHWLLVGALAIAVAFGLRSMAVPDDQASASSALMLDQPVNESETDRLIAVFEDRVARTDEYADLAALGNLYLRSAGATGRVTEYQAALSTLTEARVRAPGDTDTMLALGQAALALHDFDGAIELALQLRSLTPEDPNVYALLGDASLAIGDIEGAADAYAAIDDPEITDPSVLLRQAQLAWNHGDVEATNALSRRAMTEAELLALPAATQNIFTTAHADFLFHQGRYVEVVQLVGAIDDNPAAVHVHAEALAALGDVDSAIELLEPNAPGDVELLMLLEELYLVAGRAADGATLVPQIETLVADDPSGAFDRTVAGWLADRDRDIERAVALSTGDDRQDAGAYDTRAWVLYRAGEFEEARRFADLALNTGLPDPLIHLHSALIWQALGEPNRARTDAQTALAMSPEFSPTFAADARALVGGRGS